MNLKYEIVAEAIRSGIRSGRYQDTLPTEYALCEEFQVSRQTVRQALALLENERLIDRKQGSGSHIRSMDESQADRKRSIAVITTYISDYIFPSILREIEAVCSENNSVPLLFATQNQFANERKILQSLLCMEHLDGILVEGTKTGLPNPNIKLYQQLIEKGIPLVFMHGTYEPLRNSLTVMDDNAGGSRMLVDYLFSKGHRRIAGIFKHDDIQGRQRFIGYINAVQEHGLPLEDGDILWYSTEQKESLLNGDFAERWLDGILERCTAIICYNDEIAARVAACLAKKGVSVPGNMAIVSFDNSQYSEMTTPRISSLSHTDYNVGKLAAELLFRHMRNEECESQFAPWVLMEKESS